MTKIALTDLSTEAHLRHISNVHESNLHLIKCNKLYIIVNYIIVHYIQNAEPRASRRLRQFVCELI